MSCNFLFNFQVVKICLYGSEFRHVRFHFSHMVTSLSSPHHQFSSKAIILKTDCTTNYWHAKATSTPWLVLFVLIHSSQHGSSKYLPRCACTVQTCCNYTFHFTYLWGPTAFALGRSWALLGTFGASWMLENAGDFVAVHGR